VSLAVLAFAVVAPLYLANRQLEISQSADTPQKALVAVREAQRFNPFDPALPQREAEIRTSLGEWGRAEAAYKKAVALNPEHYAPRMNLGAFYEQRGELDKARAEYLEAWEMNPIGWDLKKSLHRVEQAPPDR
jgi:Flp pilus assembly protein TadD